MNRVYPARYGVPELNIVMCDDGTFAVTHNAAFVGMIVAADSPSYMDHGKRQFITCKTADGVENKLDNLAHRVGDLELKFDETTNCFKRDPLFLATVDVPPYYADGVINDPDRRP